MGTWQWNGMHIAGISLVQGCSYRIKKMHSFGLGEIDQDALMLKYLLGTCKEEVSECYWGLEKTYVEVGYSTKY